MTRIIIYLGMMTWRSFNKRKKLTSIVSNGFHFLRVHCILSLRSHYRTITVLVLKIEGLELYMDNQSMLHFLQLNYTLTHKTRGWRFQDSCRQWQYEAYTVCAERWKEGVFYTERKTHKKAQKQDKWVVEGRRGKHSVALKDSCSVRWTQSSGKEQVEK